MRNYKVNLIVEEKNNHEEVVGWNSSTNQN